MAVSRPYAFGSGPDVVARGFSRSRQARLPTKYSCGLVSNGKSWGEGSGREFRRKTVPIGRFARPNGYRAVCILPRNERCLPKVNSRAMV